MERRKSRARFSLFLGWVHISEKKLLKTENSVGAGAQNIGKVVSFEKVANFDPTFTDVWRA